MTGTFLAGWVKLRRPRLLLGTYAALAGMGALFTVLIFMNAEAAGSQQQRGPGEATTIADLADAGGLTAGLTNAVALLGIVALCVAAAQVAGEYTQGTLRNLLVREPRRFRLLAGNWAAVTIFMIGAVLVASLAAMVAAVAIAPSQGIDTSAWTTAVGLREAAQSVGLVTLAIVGYATLGVVLGSVLRAPVPAIAFGVAWLLAIEQVLAAVIDDAGRWLPGQLLSAIASSGTDSISLTTALATAGVYLAVAAAGAAALFSRRDVTA